MSAIPGYAAGLLELAGAEGVSGRVESELYTLRRAIETSTELRQTLGDPALPAERKTGILIELLGTGANDLTLDLVRLLVARGRAGDIAEIAASLAEQAATARDSTLAEIRTAVPLDEATTERLGAELGRVMGRKLEIRTVVDPTVLGGIVARVGDTIIDGSVATRLRSLRDAVAQSPPPTPL